jgi:hypothetical protein
MGCCGSTYSDPEIEKASTITELANVMKNKADKLMLEKQEIEKYLEDKSNPVTLVNISSLTEEDLSKRPPYLEQLKDCYGEIIDELEANPKLPLKECKEHIYNIMSNYFVSYDSTEKYRTDLAKFKQFAFNAQKKQ